jgi:hypothetical protein
MIVQFSISLCEFYAHHFHINLIVTQPGKANRGDGSVREIKKSEIGTEKTTIN